MHVLCILWSNTSEFTDHWAKLSSSLLQLNSKWKTPLISNDENINVMKQ